PNSIQAFHNSARPLDALPSSSRSDSPSPSNPAVIPTDNSSSNKCSGGVCPVCIYARCAPDCKCVPHCSCSDSSVVIKELSSVVHLDSAFGPGPRRDAPFTVDLAQRHRKECPRLLDRLAP